MLMIFGYFLVCNFSLFIKSFLRYYVPWFNPVGFRFRYIENVLFHIRPHLGELGMLVALLDFGTVFFYV